MPNEIGFEPFADFWNDAVGEHGDQFHNRYVYPALFAALGDLTGLTVLDLGSGNGASSRALAHAGGRVTGVEIAPTLVGHAREWERRNPLGIHYVVSSAAAIPDLADATFDRAVANMVLMDIEDCKGLIREVGRLLKPGGRFVATFFHPCFEPADGASWLSEHIWPDPPKISRRIWRYRDCHDAEGFAKPDQPVPQRYYHRPLSWYVERFVAAGLLIDHLGEPGPVEQYRADDPDFYARDTVVPTLIVLGAKKV
jgi:ubiquinone/menaquinone biosynthesis C-methylase UbiE